MNLTFFRSLSILNYDEFSSSTSGSSDDYRVPGAWYDEWPSFSVQPLLTMMTSLLHNTCIIDGGYVCVNALEHYMVSSILMSRSLQCFTLALVDAIGFSSPSES